VIPNTSASTQQTADTDFLLHGPGGNSRRQLQEAEPKQSASNIDSRCRGGTRQHGRTRGEQLGGGVRVQRRLDSDRRRDTG
jgi:hypothetical protein